MFSALRQRFEDWRDRRAVFQEMRHLKREEKPYQDGIVRALILRITSAAFQNRPQQALEAWQALRVQSPDIAITATEVIRAMTAMRHFDIVEESLSTAMKKFPNVAELARLYAEVAQNRGDMKEAARRWTDVRNKYPDIDAGYTFGAASLNAIGQHQEAERILGKYLQSVTQDSYAARTYAEMAEQREDWAVALERWGAMRRTIRDPDGWVGEARVLLRLEREKEALALLATAREMFPYTYKIDVAIADIHDRDESPQERLERWMTVRIRHPAAGAAHIGLARALVDLDRKPEAEATLAAFVERGSDDSNPAIRYALMAHGNDWPEAIRRWEIVRQNYPGVHAGYVWGAEALEAMGEHEQAEQVRAAAP